MRRRGQLVGPLLLVLAAVGCDGPHQNAPDGGVDPLLDAPVNPLSDAASDDAPTPDGGVASTAVDIGLDLGHIYPIKTIDTSGTRALTSDGWHWILWDLDTDTPLVSGDLPIITPSSHQFPYVPFGSATLRGTTVANLTRNALEVRDASSGAVTATIPVPPNDWDHSQHPNYTIGHAFDGSYVWVATTSSLRVYSTTGTSLIDVTGDYTAATIWSAPGELRVANGPAGTDKIELINITTQARSTYAYAGTFQWWFSDGGHFITATGSAIRIYTSSGALITFTTAGLPAGGTGNYVWTFGGTSSGYTLNIYAITNLSAPVKTFSSQTGVYFGYRHPSVVASTNSLAILPDESGSFEIVTLGQTIKRSAKIPVPAPYLDAFGGNTTRWLVGTDNGVVFDSAALTGPHPTGRSLTLGRVITSAGSATSIAALATASGRTLQLAIGTASSVERELPFMSSHLQFSADGMRLVVGGNGEFPDDQSLRVVSTATGATVKSWSYSATTSPRYLGFVFATAGEILCQFIVVNDVAQRLWTDLAGNTLPDYGPTYTVSTGVPQLSPDGTKATFWDGGDSSPVTYIYTNGTLSGAVDGGNLTWLDNNTFLVLQSSPSWTMKVYDATGAIVSTSGLDWNSVSGNLTYVGDGQVYAQGPNATFDIATGAKIWQGDTSVYSGIVVGDYILSLRGTRVFTDRFR